MQSLLEKKTIREGRFELPTKGSLRDGVGTLQSSALPLSYLRISPLQAEIRSLKPQSAKSSRISMDNFPVQAPEAKRSWTCQKKRRKKTISCFFPDRITRAESHALDATRHLDTLQYPVWNLSRLQMIHGSSNLALLCAPRECVWSWPEGYRNFNR